MVEYEKGSRDDPVDPEYRRKLWDALGDPVEAMGVSSEARDDYRKLVCLCTEMQKSVIKQAGITEVTVYRGLHDVPDDVRQQIKTSKEVTDCMASCWTQDRRVASAFARGKDSSHGLVMQAKIRVDDLLCLYGGTPQSFMRGPEQAVVSYGGEKVRLEAVQ